MQEVLQKAEALADSMKKSSAHMQYQLLYQEIKADEAIYARLSDYRRAKFSLQMNGQGNVFGELEALAREYDDVLSKEIVKNFLSAELRYCRMIRQVKEKILSSVEMDLDFLED